jgi:hypothetical protein
MAEDAGQFAKAWRGFGRGLQCRDKSLRGHASPLTLFDEIF